MDAESSFQTPTRRRRMQSCLLCCWAPEPSAVGRSLQLLFGASIGKRTWNSNNLLVSVWQIQGSVWTEAVSVANGVFMMNGNYCKIGLYIQNTYRTSICAHIYKCIYATPLHKQTSYLRAPFAQGETAAGSDVCSDNTRWTKSPLYALILCIQPARADLSLLLLKETSWALLVQIWPVKRPMTSHLLRLQQNDCGVCVSLEVKELLALWKTAFRLRGCNNRYFCWSGPAVLVLRLSRF